MIPGLHVSWTGSSAGTVLTAGLAVALVVSWFGAEKKWSGFIALGTLLVAALVAGVPQAIWQLIQQRYS